MSNVLERPDSPFTGLCCLYIPAQFILSSCGLIRSLQDSKLLTVKKGMYTVQCTGIRVTSFQGPVKDKTGGCFLGDGHDKEVRGG